IDATTNMSNNGQNAFDFPDADLGTLERDWREEPCANSYIALTSVNRTTASPNFCIDGSWIYYYVDIDSVETLNPGDSSILMMAIEHQPFGAGANTNDFAVEVSTTVSSNPLISAGVYSEEDIANEQATFVMGRYWNIDLISGSLNGFVNVRFYYAQGESDELVNTAQTWNATYADSTAFVSGLRWFAVNAGDFDPSADLTAAGVQGASQLYPTSSTEDGILYAEFELSSFTGGGLGFTVGENSVILPVELTTFDANLLADETVLVEWATASEVNNDYFMVERSADMENWTDLGKVLGAGNASTQNYYQFIDNNPLSGKSYYRLRQVDFDGGKDYSESREVLLMQDGRDQKVLLYPNPSRNEVYLSVTSEKESRFVVRNAMGQTIKTLHAVGTETLIIDDLSAGVYYLQTVGHSDASTLRFVITK
ncbi:MAG: T9SS type A sorting domain-containing protein, partial [Salibacteraceae bacterium]